MTSTKKLEEGFDRIKLAEKSLKTSFLKWRPDYEVAADEYNQAATCFKNARSFQRSKDCLLKASDCYKRNHSFFHAARCLDQAILLAKDLNDYKEVSELAEKACSLYQQHGSPESAATALDKAAKILEQHYPTQALKLYQKAAEVVLIEDSYRHAAEFMNKVARISVKLQLYDKAADAIRREIGLQQQTDHIPPIGRLAVALVLVQLARGDYVAAEKAFKEWGNCCEAPELQTLELLLQGFDDEDPDVVREALNHPFIRHMDVEYARLARDLPLPDGVPAPKDKVSAVTENAAPVYVSPNVAAKVEKYFGPVKKWGGDEDEGLC